MATLVLQTAGAVAGNFLGGPIGAVIGQAAGAIAGNVIDRQLFGSSGGRDSYGPRLSGTPAIGASEGAAIPRVFGRARLGSNVIWMTRFEEQAVITKTGSSGGKGSSGPRTTTYRYFANFAVGLCEGPIAGVRRIWVDGKELDQTEINLRVYTGDETQDADPLIVAKEGAQNAPAYRGLAYVVFERLPLDDYGNRLPVLSFEVIRPVEDLAEKIRAVCIIPGSSEYAYDPASILQLLEPGVTRAENRHQLFGDSDWTASIDTLQSICPNLESVALVVTWFGDDLRAGACSVRPRVELTNKTTNGAPWGCAGLNRFTADPVSQYEGKPAFGGTPSDDAVVRAITDLKSRGLKVVFYPFVMMDIPHGNVLADPWTGAASQPAYPWRGRIVCDPAPGQPGSVDASAVAGSQVDAFFGSPVPAASEWSFRRFILHYASLCDFAGGVDTFLVGSELASLTRVRSAPGIYPAASHLASLAGDVASVLGPQTKVSYAADWTEYGAHVLDGGDEVRFPLDVLWSAPAVDFVGIDAYWPLSDWRDGTGHLDSAVADSIYDQDYLKQGMASGEGFDWYYPSAADRESQNRIPITDGAYSKPWVFRQKDLHGWWLNQHFERVNGLELAQPTDWTPQSKPVWLTEIGCPAVDKGANAPNVFPDVKSSESAIPYFSRGNRDDLIQLRCLEAYADRFSPAAAGFQEADNPVSSIYAGRMVAADRMHVWAWDARPFPAFPSLLDTWADGAAWETGHWINGRLEAASINNIVRAIVEEVPDFTDTGITTELGSMVDGYVIDRPMSARSALEPLAMLYGFEAIVPSGRLAFSDRGLGHSQTVLESGLAVQETGQAFERVRAQESELSQSITVTVYDGDSDYRLVAAQSRKLDVFSRRQSHYEIPVVTNTSEIRRRTDILLQDLWIGRESVTMFLPPSLMALEIGDRIALESQGAVQEFQITRIEDAGIRETHARAIDPVLFDHAVSVPDKQSPLPPSIPGPAEIRVLDLAIARTQTPALQYICAFADPWPGALAIWRAAGSASFAFHGLITGPARLGHSMDSLGPGPVARYDRANTLDIKLSYGTLSSREEREALSGNPAIAIQGADLTWEVINFSTVELLAERCYRLAGLVRGIGGAEALALRHVPAGAPVVILDDAVVGLTNDIADINVAHTYRAGPARRDYADASYVEFEATASALALTPYAPVQPAAARTQAGVDIRFLRRSRLNGDAWEVVNVPLGEDSESYELEILSNGVPVRTLLAQTPLVQYSSSDELLDFGAQQTILHVRIYQISQAVGRGFPLSASLDVVQ